MTDASLVSLTYTSAATRLLSVSELVELIEQIRTKNERLGVTGLLLYSGGNVIQTLEGTPDAVDAVFDAIRSDPRHGDVHVVERREVDERSFATWSMGFRNVSAREVAELQDFGDFARESVGRDLSPHAASAFELLERFRVNAAASVEPCAAAHDWADGCRSPTPPSSCWSAPRVRASRPGRRRTTARRRSSPPTSSAGSSAAVRTTSTPRPTRSPSWRRSSPRGSAAA